MEKIEGFTQIIIEPGRKVLCDWCNADYTDRPESGGFLFGSYATCPECAPGMLESAVKFNELAHIRGYCPATQSFADWIRGMR